jgi:FkbM family methyltransferase
VAERVERAALAVLGAGARSLRALHAEPLLQIARDGVDALLVRARRPVLRGRSGGVELRGFLRHRSFLADVSSGIHEPYVVEVLLGELRPGAVFVDVGAHVGLYTLRAAERISPGGRIVSFEADPYTAVALSANVKRAELGNVRVISKAVSDHVGSTGFWLSAGTYSSSLYRRPSMASVERVEIDATTIDAEVGPADDLVIKIDVEGAELDALGGLERTVAESGRAVLVVEVNPSALAEAGRTPAELIARLRELGLELWRIDEEALAVVRLETDDTGDWKGNLVGRRGNF